MVGLTRLPRTGKGLLILVGLVLAVLLFELTITIIGFVIGVVLLAVLLYVVWVVGVNINRYLKHLLG